MSIKVFWVVTPRSLVGGCVERRGHELLQSINKGKHRTKKSTPIPTQKFV
jgi:hypothetical protein